MDIILITIGYPYPKKDVFVENEIKYISKKFDNVYIIPVLEGIVLPQKKYPHLHETLPSNVKIFNIKYTYKDLINIDKKLINLIFKEGKFNLKSLITKLRWYFHSSIVMKNINELVKNTQILPSETILYSFWFHFNAMAISYIKENFALRVSRAHGYDLYEYRGIQLCKKYMISKLDSVFACSENGKEYLQSKYNGNKFKLSYLGSINKNKIDINDNRAEIFNIVSCSRMVDLKRINKIIDSLEHIKDYKIRWTHIGDGPLYDELNKYSQEKLKNNYNIDVEFLGNLKNKYVLKYYNSNNVNLFLNVSSSEGLPISIMEAMSFGIPIIATDVGGVSEIVDGKVGYLLDKEFDNKYLSKKIIDIINMNSEEYKKFRENSFNKWSKLFNADKNYNEYFDTLLKMSMDKS